MANIDVITYNQPNTGQRLYNSLRHTGFAVIENHPISKALIDECYRIWRHFFLHEDKSDVAFCPKSHAGYIRPELSETAKGAKLKDLKEFFHLYEDGPCPTHLKETSRELMQQLTQLGSELLALIYAECPDELKQSLSMPLPAMLKNCTHQLFRIIHYPPLTGKEPKGALRAAAHAILT